MKLNLKLIILSFILVLATLLRLVSLNKVPVSLFGDELDLGYQAYSILKTGKDYSGNFMPLHFQSLAEWRTPLYLYSAVPTVAIFGISAWGVRLPAAIFGILGIFVFYLLIKQITDKEELALLGAFLLSISPWHIQYSRAGFEVTELLFFLLLGLYFFFKSLKGGKYLWLSVVSFCLTPYIYSTAKLFTPLLMLFLVVVWRKEILSLGKKYLFIALAATLLVGGPIAASTLFGGGAERFGYISVFTDPTTEAEVGVSRQNDARMRGETGTGLTPTLLDRVVHNKYTFWGSTVIKNYLQAFSTNFLFVKGDLNLRHSIGIGELYRIEFIPLLLGIIFFFTSKTDKKIKSLIGFWLLAGVIPSSITREGGWHATRLILILPPLIFLITYGLLGLYERLRNKGRIIVLGLYAILLFISVFSFQHEYWVHYPWNSERWWHAGYKESIKTIKEIDKDYDKVIISMAGEPVWIFFAGWYEYPPQMWHQGYPFKKVNLNGFGEISYIDKYYFSQAGSIYDLGKIIDSKTLYLAVAKEIGANLIMEPGRTPPDLKLIKAIAYPSGEPAFYLFSGTK